MLMFFSFFLLSFEKYKYLVIEFIFHLLFSKTILKFWRNFSMNKSSFLLSLLTILFPDTKENIILSFINKWIIDI